MWSVRALSLILIYSLVLPAPFGSGYALAADKTPAGVSLAGEVVSVTGTAFIRQDGTGQGNSKLRGARPGDQVHSGDVINTSSSGGVKLLLKDKSIVDLGPSALFKVDQYTHNSGPDRQVDVSMMYGTIRGAITQKIEGKGRFKLRTPSATMGVRGTLFVVNSGIENVGSIANAINGKNGGQEDKTKKKDDEKKPAPNVVITVLQGQVDVAKSKDGTDTKGKGDSPLGKNGTVSLTAGNQLSFTADTHTKDGDRNDGPKLVKLDNAQLTAVGNQARVEDNTFHAAIEVASSSANGNDKGDKGEHRGEGRTENRGPAEEHGNSSLPPDVVATIHDAPPPDERDVPKWTPPGVPDVRQPPPLQSSHDQTNRTLRVIVVRQ